VTFYPFKGVCKTKEGGLLQQLRKGYTWFTGFRSEKAKEGTRGGEKSKTDQTTIKIRGPARARWSRFQRKGGVPKQASPEREIFNNKKN